MDDRCAAVASNGLSCFRRINHAGDHCGVVPGKDEWFDWPQKKEEEPMKQEYLVLYYFQARPNNPFTSAVKAADMQEAIGLTVSTKEKPFLVRVIPTDKVTAFIPASGWEEVD